MGIVGCQSTQTTTTEAAPAEPVTAEPTAAPTAEPQTPPEPDMQTDVYAQRAQPFTREQVDKLENNLKPLESVETRPDAQR
jgi:hypothetical protein